MKPNEGVQKPIYGFEQSFLHKSGVQNVDKSSISSLIKSITAGSKFQHSIDAKARRISAQVEDLKMRLINIRQTQCLHNDSTVEAAIKKATAKSESVLQSETYFMHLDMDAFYASIEELLNPGLAAIPMAVGHLSMLSTANYAARKYGIASAMPGYIAMRLCPDLVILPVRMKIYEAYGMRIRQILRVSV